MVSCCHSRCSLYFNFAIDASGNEIDAKPGIMGFAKQEGIPWCADSHLTQPWPWNLSIALIRDAP